MGRTAQHPMTFLKVKANKSDISHVCLNTEASEYFLGLMNWIIIFLGM